MQTHFTQIQKKLRHGTEINLFKSRLYSYEFKFKTSLLK